MPGDALRLTLSPGRGKDLRAIARALRSMDDRRVGLIFRRNLRAVVKPLVPAVRARILAIPVHGTKQTGLRLRLAGAVSLTSRTTGKYATVAVYMDPVKMPSGQYSLPEMEEGLKLWAHPVYGRYPDVIQGFHPYFYPVVAVLGHGSEQAVIAAMDEIKTDVDGW